MTLIHPAPACHLETNTILAYFAVFEAGMTIIAVNLPSLWYYLRGISPDRALRSVRSVFSLHSGHDSQTSVKSATARDRHPIQSSTGVGPSSESNSSHNDVVGRGDQQFGYPKDSSLESYAMSDVPHPKPVAEGGDGIQVKRSIQRTEEQSV
jgi:hypothetical protein